MGLPARSTRISKDRASLAFSARKAGKRTESKKTKLENWRYKNFCRGAENGWRVYALVKVF